MFELLEKGKHALVLAIGGGGDIASAVVIARSLARFNVKYTLASIAWERFVYDPVPGPIRLDEVRNYVKRGEGYVVVDKNSYAVRNDRKVVFQAVNASKATGEHVYVVDVYGGVRGYVEAMNEVISSTGADYVLGVDVGGDSLATGCEETLWSPLADWMGVSAVGSLKGVLAVHSLGSDGELEQNYLLTRVDQISQRGGLIAVSSLSRRDAELLEELLRYVKSEASMVSLLALKGYRGLFKLRMGSRSVNVNLISTFTFYLLADVVSRDVSVLNELASTRSLSEANNLLNRYGIYTELNLEEDLAELGVKPEELMADHLTNVRSRGLRELENARRSYCSKQLP
ncbi:MAG: DUF1152 domain-containing protein [Desulfurococcaceae archaeon]